MYKVPQNFLKKGDAPFLFHMFSSTLSSQQSHRDIRWGNIMCYHGGDLPNSRHKEAGRKTPWLGGGGGFQHNCWGRDKRLPPLDINYLKEVQHRGSSSTIAIDLKKWGHKSSRSENTSRLLLVVSEPSFGGPQSGEAFRPPRIYIHPTVIYTLLCSASSFKFHLYLYLQKILGALITCTNCLYCTIISSQKSYLLSSSTPILANPHVAQHLCLHDKK